jgi:hypothetical protein
MWWKQWKRSSIGGYVSRLWEVVFGRPCYMRAYDKCRSRMRITSVLEADGSYMVRWGCRRCGSKMTEIF